MLTIKRVKELIGDQNVSNEEAERIRDDCRIFAEIIFEKWIEEKRGRIPVEYQNKAEKKDEQSRI